MPHDAQANSPLAPIVHVADLCYTVDDKQILRNISFDVMPNEIFGVMGGSGSGKSTLLRCLMALIPATSGHIEIAGDEITGKTEDELNLIRTHMGMCFQYAALFDSMTVAENIAFGLQRHKLARSDEIIQLVEEYLGIVGLAGIGDYYPSDLSGGMRKRVGIARALILRPHVILYDEPTSGLDPLMSAQINNLIVQLRDQFGTTSIVVTHEVDELFGIADRVLMIADSRVVACDTPAAILAVEDPVVHDFVQAGICHMHAT